MQRFGIFGLIIPLSAVRHGSLASEANHKGSSHNLDSPVFSMSFVVHLLEMHWFLQVGFARRATDSKLRRGYSVSKILLLCAHDQARSPTACPLPHSLRLTLLVELDIRRTRGFHWGQLIRPKNNNDDTAISSKPATVVLPGAAWGRGVTGRTGSIVRPTPHSLAGLCMLCP